MLSPDFDLIWSCWQIKDLAELVEETGLSTLFRLLQEKLIIFISAKKYYHMLVYMCLLWILSPDIPRLSKAEVGNVTT